MDQPELNEQLGFPSSNLYPNLSTVNGTYDLPSSHFEFNVEFVINAFKSSKLKSPDILDYSNLYISFICNFITFALSKGKLFSW